jgi:class 3 adenylate cyclase
MTSDMQREALAVLAEVWALSPDVRLGQLLTHLGFLGEAHLGRGLGYIEDDELIAILYRHRAELMARSQRTPDQASQPTGSAISVSGSSTLPESAPTAELRR